MGAVNKRLPGRKIEMEDGGVKYTREVELPNGHKWRQRADGGWCRFSKKTCYPSGKQSKGKQQAQAQTPPWPEPPTGYHWRKGKTEPVLVRKDKSLPILKYDKNTKGFVKVSGPNKQHDYNNLSFDKKSSPIKIPEKAVVIENIKAAGYTQVSFRWTRGGFKYESRWHTPTKPELASQGNTWVITRTTPGNSTGGQKVQHILVGKNKWVNMNDWQNAVKGNQNGTATDAQKKLLEGGHHSSY